MNTPLILVAASGLGREALEAARAQGQYDVIGFVDDDPIQWGEVVGGVKVLGGLDAIAAHQDAALLVCVGRGAVRRGIVDRLAAELAVEESRYATVIHPGVGIPASCTVGAGSIVLAGCALTADVSIGRHVVVMPNVTLTHDDELCDYATICAGVTLGGSVRIGSRAYLGMCATVRERLSVGDDAVIGMGAVVVADVPASETWFGVPARRRVMGE